MIISQRETYHFCRIIVIFFWFIFAGSFCEADDFVDIKTTYQKTTSYVSRSAVDFSILGLHLRSDTNNLLHDVAFHATILHKEDTKVLDNLMVNVTDGCYAYRLLPHGVHFTKPALLEIAYDPLALPIGYQAEDIHTYYYDEELGSWQQLQRVGIDTIRNIIISSTSHFTDFINAVIRIPDMPEVNAFVPTQMSDIESPHPLLNREIITEPNANPLGTAEVTYPLSIPLGRNGMQPNMDLLYNSSGGLSVLGSGWSLPLPAITIDTRWGVPRYDTKKETEIYLLDGTQIVQKDGNSDLTFSYQVHTLNNRRTGNVMFMDRDTKKHNLIVRHGTNPQNYWWSVIDNNGTTYYYGKYSTDVTINDNCILTDNSGNIGYWTLTEMVDIHGNYVKYEYEKSDRNEIYLMYVYYTGHIDNHSLTDLCPPYRIRLHYDYVGEVIRSDCRLGFVRELDRKICFIDESYLEDATDTIYTPFVRYFFDVNNNNVEDGTMLLHSISKYRMPRIGEECDAAIQQYGEDWCYIPIECGDNSYMLNNTIFTYYQPSDIFESVEHVLEDNNEGHSQLLELRNTDWSLGGTLTLGLGPDAWTTNISAGGNYSYSKTKGEVDMLLMDIDGDGLADKVYVQDDSIYYRKQIVKDTIPYFAQEKNVGIPAKNLSQEVSKTNSWGLQAGAALPKEVAGANISGGWSVTNTQTKSFFADVNGDGLPDYIDDGVVYFNRLKSYSDFTKHKGEYTIIVDSAQCSQYFYYDGQINTSINCHIDSVIIGSYTADGVRHNNYYFYNPDCALICQEYIEGRTEFQYLCEECLQTTPVYLDSEYNIITEVDNYYCNTHPGYEDATQLCPECLLYLTDDYGHDIDSYIGCAETCYAADTSLYWSLKGCCYTSEECPSDNCFDYARDIRADCDNECIERLEVCAECMEQCQTFDDACYECKRDNYCKGAIEDFITYEACYAEGHPLCECVGRLYDSGEICEECMPICKFHPELCLSCLNRNCEYLSSADIAYHQIYDWKSNMRSAHPNAVFVQNGWTITAYDTMTVCPPLDEELMPNMEAVRVWVVPKDGTIRLISTIQLIEDNSNERIQSRSADGVRCIIQHDKQVVVGGISGNRLVPTETVLIDNINISAVDYDIHSKEYINISVHKGDVLSFHLMSKGSHSFDDVDWKQHIHYYNLSGSYYSDNEYICSSKETFQYDTIGIATLEIWADVEDGGSAILNTMIGNNVYATCNITASHNNYVLQRINNIKPDKDNAIYLTLYSLKPSKIRVKCKVTFRYGNSLNSTITKWIVPDVSFPQNSNETHNDIYYDLFGPLYRGWGQYTFNNKFSSTLIPLDSLYNPYQTTYNAVHTDTASYRASIESVADMNPQQIMSAPESLETAFAQNGLYNPLNQMWVAMSVDAENYQWESFGKVARIGKTQMSNTRDETQLLSAVGTTFADNEDFEIYDNAIPKHTTETRVMAVRKESKSKQWNLSYGANLGGVAGVGKSMCQGTYKLLTDYMDMNGDLYPDIVYENIIQYTKPWGGLGETQDINAHLHETQIYTEGYSFSGNFGKTIKLPGGVRNDRYMTSVSGSTGAGTANSTSETSFILTDVNSDGLPDKLISEGDSTRIYLNIGYGFIPYKTIPRSVIDKTYSESLSGNVGLSLSNSWGEAVWQLLNSSGNAVNDKASLYQASISAGCSASSSVNTTQMKLVDIDGNGRLDLLERNQNGLFVTLNVFNQGDSEHRYINQNFIQRSESNSAALNLALTGGFSILGILKICAGVQTTPISISETLGRYDLIDMNADGLPDLVRVHNGKIHVRYNISGKRGLLKTITNITGNQIELDYTLSSPSTEQPCRQMLLTSIKNIYDTATIDIGTPIVAKRFSYYDPHYDIAERLPYGYGSVHTYELYSAADGDTAQIYRKYIRRYQNREFADHGKLIYEALLDSADNIYTEYELGTIYYDVTGNETEDVCQDMKIRVGKEAHYMRYYEGTSEPITTAKVYDYDQYHNITRYENIGDSIVEEDNLLANITYENSTPLINKNLVSLPSRMLISASGQEVRRVKAEYNQDGDIVKHITTSLVNGNDSSITEYAYDRYGLLSHAILPSNAAGQCSTIDILYDSLTYTLPYQIMNQWGQTQKFIYSPQWQLPLYTVDSYGDSILYQYDRFGRVIAITAPQERLSGTKTITYTYGTINNPIKHLYVDTKTYCAGDSTIQRSLYDQRGVLRQTQTRSSDGFFVSERNSYDSFGRLIKSYSPTSVDALSPYLINDNRQLIATYSYDILNRQTSVIWNDAAHSSTTMQYQLGADAFGIKRLQTIRVDENGLSWNNYTTPQGWLTTTITPDGATTKFVYDALGQLLSSTDPDGIVTSHTYNGLGRRIQRSHPDAGTTSWRYDSFGNVVSSQTQLQADNGTQTDYRYSYNRLDSICYSAGPDMTIFFEYDSVGGRLIRQTDMSGYEMYDYDEMGNVTTSERLIVLPNENRGYKFTTKYRYDSFGKILTILYPDSECVSYHYKNGLLNKVQGIQNNSSVTREYHYIDSIHYDAYSRQDYILAGNQYNTFYYYDPIRSWLKRQNVYEQRYTLSNIYYEYDGTGNVLGIEQIAERPALTWLGGPYTLLYDYDEQNRLVTADMVSNYWGEYSNYTMTYSPSGLVGMKNCDDMLWNYWFGYKYDNHFLNHQVRSIYDLENDETTFLTWDANGQLLNVMRPCLGDFRYHWWNESGQMVAFVDNERCGYYGYNANGERVYKLTGHTLLDQYNAGVQNFQLNFNDAVLYVNPYFVVTPKGYTKHYYNGSQRIAAQIGKLEDLPESVIDTSDVAMERLAAARHYMAEVLDISEIQLLDTNSMFADIDGDVYEELQWQCYDTDLTFNAIASCDSDMLYPILTKDASRLDTRVSGIYYYHSDHLGGANWITDSKGVPVEFIHYMPYGELWYNQQASAYNERYKFTGKERDTETGYDYFGARYYSSTLPLWLSVDPLADKYPNISPYAYCNWNPLRFIDLNGENWYESENGEIKWTDSKNQTELTKNNIIGTYLGEAVVVFNGSTNECWGTDNTLTGDNANPAIATIYGINGYDDMQTYRGMTIPQSNSYSMLNAGDYNMAYQDMATSIYGEKGAIAKGIAPALTYRITTLDGKTTQNGTKNGKETMMNGVFMHRTDWTGKANVSSKGCMIIDGRQWRNVEKQLQKSSNIYLRINR